MRIFFTIVAAVGLAVLVVNAFMHQHWLSGTAFLAGFLVLVLPLLFGRGLGNLEDADLLMRFVKSPFGTVVDETIDRLVPDGEPEPEKRAPDSAAARPRERPRSDRARASPT